jgi:hypothetical protein
MLLWRSGLVQLAPSCYLTRDRIWFRPTHTEHVIDENVAVVPRHTPTPRSIVRRRKFVFLKVLPSRLCHHSQSLGVAQSQGGASHPTCDGNYSLSLTSLGDSLGTSPSSPTRSYSRFEYGILARNLCFSTSVSNFDFLRTSTYAAEALAKIFSRKKGKSLCHFGTNPRWAYPTPAST